MKATCAQAWPRALPSAACRLKRCLLFGQQANAPSNTPSPGHAPALQFLENVLHATPALAELRTVDEAIVIGAALSLSSSAFVLQLLRERGELDSRFGQATLGILLLQDIATVPFLVLLPLVEGSNAGWSVWGGTCRCRPADVCTLGAAEAAAHCQRGRWSLW